MESNILHYIWPYVVFGELRYMDFCVQPTKFLSARWKILVWVIRVYFGSYDHYCVG